MRGDGALTRDSLHPAQASPPQQVRSYHNTLSATIAGRTDITQDLVRGLKWLHHVPKLLFCNCWKLIMTVDGAEGDFLCDRNITT